MSPVVDLVDSKTRSKMMSKIRSKNTNPELIIRSALFARGFRYRLHDKSIIGKPDIILRPLNAVVFIHGCFWHGHKCHLFRWPSTRSEWWREKINGNRLRDSKVSQDLRIDGWRQARIWECVLKGKSKHDIETIINELIDWLNSDNKELEIM